MKCYLGQVWNIFQVYSFVLIGSIGYTSISFVSIVPVPAHRTIATESGAAEVGSFSGTTTNKPYYSLVYYY
jgi:hypothetical protein